MHSLLLTRRNQTLPIYPQEWCTSQASALPGPGPVSADPGLGCELSWMRTDLRVGQNCTPSVCAGLREENTPTAMISNWQKYCLRPWLFCSSQALAHSFLGLLNRTGCSLTFTGRPPAPEHRDQHQPRIRTNPCGNTSLTMEMTGPHPVPTATQFGKTVAGIWTRAMWLQSSDFFFFF